MPVSRVRYVLRLLRTTVGTCLALSARTAIVCVHVLAYYTSHPFTTVDLVFRFFIPKTYLTILTRSGTTRICQGTPRDHRTPCALCLLSRSFIIFFRFYRWRKTLISIRDPCTPRWDFLFKSRSYGSLRVLFSYLLLLFLISIYAI